MKNWLEYSRRCLLSFEH